MQIYIIIILLILILILILYTKREGFISGNEAVLNISKVYSDVSGTVVFNNINVNKFKANDISGNNISGNNISGNNISGNDISGNNISGNNISGNNISGNNISGNKLNIANTNFDISNTKLYIDREIIVKDKLCIQSTTDNQIICLSPDTSTFGGLSITKKNNQKFSIFSNGNNAGLGTTAFDTAYGGGMNWANLSS
jgi:hypothetical protein